MVEELSLDEFDEDEIEIDVMSGASHLRQKREAAILIFSQQLFDLACANRDACNPVLRASANSVIER